MATKVLLQTGTHSQLLYTKYVRVMSSYFTPFYKLQ